MKRDRLTLIFALVLLVIAGVAYSFWYQAVVAASANAASLASSIASANQVSQAARAARSAQNGLGGSEDAVNHYFLAESDVVPFLEALQAAGTAAGAQVVVSSVGAAAGKTNTLAVSLHITGSFNAVARAAGAIEYAPYALTEQSLVFGNEGKGVWHADQSISVGTQGPLPTR